MSDETSARGRIRVVGYEPQADEKSADRLESTVQWNESDRRRQQPSEQIGRQQWEPTTGWRRVWQRFRRNRAGMVSLGVVAVLSILSVLARPIELWGVPVQPLSLAPYSPSEMLWLTHDVSPYDPPSLAHPMGVDGSGRDVFSRVLVGGRYSVSIGFVVVALTSTIGLVYGAVAGYYGGQVDRLLMRIVDVILAFPGLVLALVIVAVFGGGYWQLVAAFSIFGWAGYARLVRGEVLKIREREFVRAAKALGARDRTILARHVVPNTLAPVLALATLNVGTVVIGVAALGFLGLGLSPASAEWGTMLENSRDAIIPGPDGDVRWWVTVFPGGAIFLFVMAMNVLGDAVSDALEVRETDVERER